MGLHGKLVAAIEFKAGGDVFHELFRHKPQDFASATPRIQGCDLIEGKFGDVGTILCWTYTHDGKQRKAKEVVESIDDEKKLIVLKVLEGNLMEEYKNFVITSHVETNDGIDLVTWSLEYEMLNEDVGHPLQLLSYFIDITKDVESHHIAKS